MARRFCDKFIEHPSDPHGGTYCKLPGGHQGDHDPHYAGPWVCQCRTIKDCDQACVTPSLLLDGSPSDAKAAAQAAARATARTEEPPEGPACALCNGDGDACNPGNADPHRRVTDWLPPVLCPRCKGSGKDPSPT